MSTSADSNAVLSLLTGRTPTYRDAHDALIFALHTHLLRRGLTCIALTPPSSSSPSSSLSTPPRELPYVPPGWNASDDAYSFTYQLPHSPGVTVIMKGVRMGGTLLVHVLRQTSAPAQGTPGATGGAKDSTPVSLEVNVSDYVNAGAALTDYRALYTDLGGLLMLFDSQLGSRILPANAEPVAAQESAPRTLLFPTLAHLPSLQSDAHNPSPPLCYAVCALSPLPTATPYASTPCAFPPATLSTPTTTTMTTPSAYPTPATVPAATSTTTSTLWPSPALAPAPSSAPATSRMAQAPVQGCPGWRRGSTPMGRSRGWGTRTSMSWCRRGWGAGGVGREGHLVGGEG